MYSARSNIEAAFGLDNVLSWATLQSDDSDATKAARIARAITVADAEIDGWCRGMQYAIPLETAAGATPTIIEEISAQLAGVWLYESHGVKDYRDGKITHRLTWHRAHCRQMLQQIRERLIILDAVEGH